MLRRRIGPWALALALTFGLLTAAQAGAAQYVVTKTADTPVGASPCLQNDCSLRAAVEAATTGSAEPDVIIVPPGTYTLTTKAPLTIPSAQQGITIAGAGANQTIISGAGGTRVLLVDSEAEVAVTGVTLREGFASDGTRGGNVSVQSLARLTLDHVRVTGGAGGGGAGIAGFGAARIEISHSLIDQNLAVVLPSPNDGGGGILIVGTTGGTDLLLRDTTVAQNSAWYEGGAIAVRSNTVGSVTLQGVSVVGNQTVTTTTGGGLFSAAGPIRVGGSILAGNTGAGGIATNCGGVAPVDDGGNVESGSDCGLKAAGLQNTDPQLSAALVDAGGQTPLFTLAPTSPAIDVAACTTATDQRDLARPQGPLCDAGAYELAQSAPPPPPPPVVVDPPLTLPPPRQLVPVRGQHVIGVAAKGKVLVRLPGTRRFVPLSQVRELPLGTVVNATAGRIRITSAADAKGRTQTAVFYGGIFKIGEIGPARRPTTVLTLFGNKPRCPKAKPKAKRAEPSRKRKSRRLWGNGRGRFQTKGQYSSATVRGTKWLVQDSCKGTLTKVTRGSVTVRDFGKRKNVIVKAGRRYLARP